MTDNNRRKDDRHPDQPLQWDDTAGAPLAATPAAGQAGLAKPIGFISRDTLAKLEGPDLAADEHVRLWHAENPPSRAQIPVYLAAPVAAATEQAIPEGYKLVPIKPTPEMSTAGKHSLKGAVDMYERAQAESVYASMVAAAPCAAPASAGAGLTVRTWQERMGGSWAEMGSRAPAVKLTEQAMCAEIADLRAALARLSKPSAQAPAGMDEREAFIWSMGHAAGSAVNLVEKVAPLATPADAGAGLTEKELHTKFVQIITGATSLGEQRVYDLADALVKESARMSTSGAPVTAEPVAWMVKRSSDGHVFGTYPSEVAAMTVRGWSEDCKVIPLYATPAPAARDEIRAEALEEAAREAEDTDIATYSDTHELQDDGIATRANIATAIRALKSMVRAADAKGDA